MFRFDLVACVRFYDYTRTVCGYSTVDSQMFLGFSFGIRCVPSYQLYAMINLGEKIAFTFNFIFGRVKRSFGVFEKGTLFVR